MKRLPFVAVVLAIAGLLPLIFCACGIVFFASGVPIPNLMMAFVSYCAVSLAFFGAVHWGLALEPAPMIVTSGADRTDIMRLVLGVVPAFIGWVATYTAFAWMPVAGVAILAVAVPLLACAGAAGVAHRRLAERLYGPAVDCNGCYGMLPACGACGAPLLVSPAILLL
ncbi:hypothetical protein Amal_02510 [Acetobacter malorum]|uniref:DUF3429 domain-containing protein n=1 Tax=Acetobacter malorum TaxID=178901 RepID=A0A177GAA7_9PROT|nr:DUF3429 domain-containing protein [Acetobacter malorum]OAG76736.1 hypothetical protein Amal_02510 [Acetobacter malorum]